MGRSNDSSSGIIITIVVVVAVVILVVLAIKLRSITCIGSIGCIIIVSSSRFY